MSWLGSTGLADFALSALNEAQKRIDKVLDIKEDKKEGGHASVKSKVGHADPTVNKVVKQSGRDREKEKSPQSSSSLGNNAKQSLQKSPDKTQHQAMKPVSPDVGGEFSWNVLFDGESSNSPPKTANRQGRRPANDRSPNKKSRESIVKSSRESTAKEDTATVSVSVDKQTPRKDRVERRRKESGSAVKTNVGCDKAGKPLIAGDSQKEKEKQCVTEKAKTDGSAVCGDEEMVEKDSTVNNGRCLTETDGVREQREILTDKSMEGLLSDEEKDKHQRLQQSQPIDKTNESFFHPKEETNVQLASLTPASIDDSQLQTVELHTNSSVREDNTPLEHMLEVNLLPPTSLDNGIDQMACSEQTVRNGSQGGSLMGHSTDKLAEKAGRVADPNVTSMEKEVARLSELAQTRENQLMTATQENAALKATNDSLKDQLEKMEESYAASNTDLDSVRAEFSDRINSTEKKLQTISRDRDQLKRRLQDLETEQQNRIDSDLSAVTAAVKEKDEQIAGLMEEGERLSKQQLQHSNTIKKLRASTKQDQQLLASQKSELERLEAEVKDLKETLKQKEENEEKYQDAVSKLTAVCEHQNKELSSLKEELDATLTRMRGLEGSLDNSYREVAELRRSQVASESAAQQAALSAEVQAKEELKQVLENQKTEAHRHQEALAMQIDDMRHSMSRSEQQAARREDNLRQEIADLQQRLQEAESRNEELSQSVALATRPLLRQIENLQHTHRSQSAAWERVERNLTERLSETQSLLATATERERLAIERVSEIQSRVQSLDTQSSTHRQEKSRLAAEVEMLQARCDGLEESLAAERARNGALQSEHARVLEHSKKEKLVLEHQLEQERARADIEAQKANTAVKQRDAQIARQQSLSSIPSSGPPSPMSSLPSIHLPSQDEILERSLHLHSPHDSMGLSFRPERSGGSRTTLQPVLEGLQAQLKQRDGEVHSLQSEIVSLEKTRESLGEELVTLSTKNSELELEVSRLSECQSQYQELEQRYAAMLQMYGEKAEEAEELRLDLQDVKSMYRQQIQQLLEQPESL